MFLDLGCPQGGLAKEITLIWRNIPGQMFQLLKGSIV